eukprot:TRINITY_DN29560_c0_g1_i1.p1 TRINITY_DN29560_c0_g1~~TRINITY_DN29560_c0_g1_i1.p1  ORF type:complete len:256 (+),score=43.52 TRINITY_DN29560_c0_g1_i1:75-770(+)
MSKLDLPGAKDGESRLPSRASSTKERRSSGSRVGSKQVQHTGPNCRHLLRNGAYCVAASPSASVPVDAVLGHRLVGLYFSGSWCPPCRMFTPLLSEAYTKIRDYYGDRAIEIVLVPRDKTRAEWLEYASSMPWISLAFNHPVTFQLKAMFDVTQLPQLVIVTREGGLVCENARGGKTGFGFGREHLDAYVKLSQAAGIPLEARRRDPDPGQSDAEDDDDDADSSASMGSAI